MPCSHTSDTNLGSPKFWISQRGSRTVDPCGCLVPAHLTLTDGGSPSMGLPMIKPKSVQPLPDQLHPPSSRPPGAEPPPADRRAQRTGATLPKRALRHQRLLGQLSLVAVLILAAPAWARPIIYLQPLQPAPDPLALSIVVAGLQAFYPVDVKVLPMLPMPSAAWYPPRQRWRAEKLLEFLENRLPSDGIKVLGLTTADISTSHGKVADWGVLGLGTLNGKSCVISMLRTRRGVSARVARLRLAKVAVHEVGHTFDLAHCPSRGCLMQDARGKVATTDREDDLCPVCRRKLAGQGIAVPEKVAAPWAP